MNRLCRGSKARFIARFPGSAAGLRFECDVRNGMAREVFFTGKYEPPETMLIRQLVGPGGTFVDVGAHWGYFTLILAEQVGTTGRVIAIEADPRIHAVLERNVAMNDLPQVQAVYAAAAAVSGLQSLFGFDERSDNWGTSRIGGESGLAGASYEVPARSLDELLDELRVGAVDLVKIDIEGGEALALSGMSAGLGRGRYHRILLELHPDQLADHGTSAAAVIDGLCELGYRAWVIAHSAADVRRTAYARNQPVESLIRPLVHREALDAWPHLLFALENCDVA
jgi:FkbM family methyltransferase